MSNENLFRFNITVWRALQPPLNDWVTEEFLKVSVFIYLFIYCEPACWQWWRSHRPLPFQTCWSSTGWSPPSRWSWPTVRSWRSCTGAVWSSTRLTASRTGTANCWRDWSSCTWSVRRENQLTINQCEIIHKAIIAVTSVSIIIFFLTLSFKSSAPASLWKQDYDCSILSFFLCSIRFYSILYACLCCVQLPIGTQGAADWDSAAELSGRAVQPAELSRTSAVFFRNHLPRGVWWGENRRTGPSKKH